MRGRSRSTGRRTGPHRAPPETHGPAPRPCPSATTRPVCARSWPPSLPTRESLGAPAGHHRQMGMPLVVVERDIAVVPQVIFDLLADPARHPEIDGSGTVRGAAEDNPERLSLG